MMINSDLSALALRIGDSQPSRIPSTDHQEFKSACLARSSGQPAKLAVPMTPASISTLEAELWRIEPGTGIDSRVPKSAAIAVVGVSPGRRWLFGEYGSDILGLLLSCLKGAFA